MSDQKFSLWLIVILALLVIIFLRDSSQPSPHEISQKDRQVIQKAREVLLNELNLEWMRLEFSSEKGKRYTLCCYSERFLGPVKISIRSFGDKDKDLKTVTKQIFWIINQMGIEATIEKVSKLERKIVVPRHFPEQLGKIIEELGRYFHNLKIVDWKSIMKNGV